MAGAAPVDHRCYHYRKKQSAIVSERVQPLSITRSPEANVLITQRPRLQKDRFTHAVVL